MHEGQTEKVCDSLAHTAGVPIGGALCMTYAWQLILPSCSVAKCGFGSTPCRPNAGKSSGFTLPSLRYSTLQQIGDGDPRPSSNTGSSVESECWFTRVMGVKATQSSFGIIQRCKNPSLNLVIIFVEIFVGHIRHSCPQASRSPFDRPNTFCL